MVTILIFSLFSSTLGQNLDWQLVHQNNKKEENVGRLLVENVQHLGIVVIYSIQLFCQLLSTLDIFSGILSEAVPTQLLWKHKVFLKTLTITFLFYCRVLNFEAPNLVDISKNFSGSCFFYFCCEQVQLRKPSSLPGFFLLGYKKAKNCISKV